MNYQEQYPDWYQIAHNNGSNCNNEKYSCQFLNWPIDRFAISLVAPIRILTSFFGQPKMRSSLGRTLALRQFCTYKRFDKRDEIERTSAF